MRIERVAPEHDRDVALARLEVVDAPAADQDVPAVIDRVRDHPQQRDLPQPDARPARRIPVGDVDVDALHDETSPKRLSHCER